MECQGQIAGSVQALDNMVNACFEIVKIRSIYGL